jgi:hypothetical protein
MRSSKILRTFFMEKNSIGHPKRNFKTGSHEKVDVIGMFDHQ